MAVNYGESAWLMWTKLRQSAPLVQCITNYVSMDLMANGLLAAGCSPAMVYKSQDIVHKLLFLHMYAWMTFIRSTGIDLAEHGRTHNRDGLTL